MLMRLAVRCVIFAWELPYDRVVELMRLSMARKCRVEGGISELVCSGSRWEGTQSREQAHEVMQGSLKCWLWMYVFLEPMATVGIFTKCETRYEVE